MALSDNIRYLLDVQGLNQSELARDAKLSPSAVCRWLSGDTLPNAKSLQALSTALHCSIADLTGHSLPVHIRRWAPAKDTCERKLAQHLQGESALPSEVESLAVIEKLSAPETQLQPRDGVLTAGPVSCAALPLQDVQALFDACVDDNAPEYIFSEFGKQVYQLMVETRKDGVK